MQSVLSSKLYWWRRFPYTLIFYRKRENMTSLWRHLRPTCRSLGKFLPPKCVKLIKGEVCKIWWKYLLSIASYRKKRWRGPFQPPLGRSLMPPPPSLSSCGWRNTPSTTALRGCKINGVWDERSPNLNQCLVVGAVAKVMVRFYTKVGQPPFLAEIEANKKGQNIM